MKKALLVLLAFVVCFSCTGCALLGVYFSSSTNSTEQNLPFDDEGDEDQATSDETFGMGDEMEFDKLTFTAMEFKQLSSGGIFQPAEGKVFIGVRFIVENTSDEEVTVSSLVMMSSRADGETVTESISAVGAFGSKMLSGTLAAGDELTGWYCMEVSRDWQSFEIEIRPNLFSTEKATFVYER